MYKICVALITVLAIAAAKPSLGYSYAAPYSVHDVAPLAASYSAYSAPAVYSAAPSVYPAAHSVYAPSVYSAQSYPVVAKTYAAAPVAAPVATYAAAPYTTYAAAPVASYAAAPVASYAAAPVATYAAAPVAQAYSAYSAYPAVGYSGYSAPLSYGSTYGELPLWKKK